jgi:hypothetical protein
MEHLRTLSVSDHADRPLKDAATTLLSVRLDQPALVTLGGAPDLQAVRAATAILNWCQSQMPT